MHFSTHSLARRRSAVRIGHLAPTLGARTSMIPPLFSPGISPARPFPPACAPERGYHALSRPRASRSFSPSLLVFLHSRRPVEAKVEANHHAITAPGAAGTPTRSQKAATAFCRPGAFTTAPPRAARGTAAAKPTIFVLCAARKKEHCLPPGPSACPSRAPRCPPLFAKSPEGRPIVPTTGIRRIHPRE